jgi:hypothetical protein
MTFAYTAMALAGATIVGGAMSASATRSAANTQAQASQAAQDAQERMYERQVQLNEPFRQAGIASQNRLMTLLGINSPTPTSSGGGLFGGVGDAVRMATGAGTTAGSEFVTDPNSADFGKYARDFGAADFQTDPGYAFRLSEGMKALDRTAAARGGLLSGSTLKGAERFNQDLASQEYQNAYNRYQTNRANQLNPLMGYASGPGMSATAASSGAAQNFGTQTGQNLQNAASARASGYIGGANSLNQAIGNVGNIYSNYGRNQLLSNMYGNQGNVSYIEMGGP